MDFDTLDSRSITEGGLLIAGAPALLAHRQSQQKALSMLSVVTRLPGRCLFAQKTENHDFE